MNLLQYRARFWYRRLRTQPDPLPGFSIVVVTYDRIAFLRHTVAELLRSTSGPFELIIWDNASSDGTEQEMRALAAADPRVRYLRSARNLGTSGYAPAFLEARHEFLVEVDDDILAIPDGWDGAMAEAFQAFPDLGYLALDVIRDRFTNGAKPDDDAYVEESRGELTLQVGPVGGWFTATTREIYDRVGGFIFDRRRVFVMEDGDFVDRIGKVGLRAGVLKDLCVYHACSHAWNAAFEFHGLWRIKHEESRPEVYKTIFEVGDDERELDVEFARRALAEEDVARAAARITGRVHNTRG